MSALTIKTFLRARRASLPVIAALALIPMTLMTGGALDFIRYERVRVALQDALDRGVLAAASLTQTQDPVQLVKSYLANVPSGATATLTLDDDNKLNARKVTASATIALTPGFLQLAGIERLTVTASSAAEESRSNIEMSLVLDISGSMYDNGGMTQLRPAAKSFLDIILKEDVRAITSVSIVPFAGLVNVGYDVFNALSGFIPASDTNGAKTSAATSGKCTPSLLSTYQRRHCYTSCFEFADADFGAVQPVFALRDQVPHFTFYNYNATGKKPWWCPTDDAAITYLSNDLAYLKQRVDALQPFDGTGTAYGMKWAELLLNPSMRPAVKAIAGIAAIPPTFTDRPAAFEDKDSKKFIVLMTDGQIGFQPRPKDPATNAVTNKNINGEDRTLYTEAKAGDLYKKVCAYAKAEGITIFTIAFKVNAAVAANIATCASDPSYAYKVDGLDMGAAFQSIATTMQKIRLVQ